jgi:hypothetical protein
MSDRGFASLAVHGLRPFWTTTTGIPDEDSNILRRAVTAASWAVVRNVRMPVRETVVPLTASTRKVSSRRRRSAREFVRHATIRNTSPARRFRHD